MAVFIRKFQAGGNPQLPTQDSPQVNNVNSEVQSPKFIIGNYQINTSDFYNDLQNNFQKFCNMYEGTWTEKERREILRDHDLFLRNLQSGNILGIDENGTFAIANPEQTGIDFSPKGSWGRYSYFVNQVANAEKIQKSSDVSKERKFTNTSILEDIHNQFFGGTDNPDYKSFYDLDEVVENADGKKVRGVKNRVNALLDLLNENYMQRFTDADESLGGLQGATERVDRLRKALSDGTLNNEDYSAAAALGLNLRGLLSTDGDLAFNDSGGFASTEPEQSEQTSTGSAIDQLREMAFGKQESADEILSRINSWDKSVDNSYNIGVDRAFKADDYLKRRMTARRESAEYLGSYYRDSFFPKFFNNLKTYTPEFLQQNPNSTVETWEGNQKVSDYVRINLTIAIRNKLYGDGTLLSKKVNDELNQIVGTNFWTVPDSFDENSGTVLLFNPDTGEYRRVSITNENLMFNSPADNSSHSLLRDYLFGKGVRQAKHGAKLQLGGNINGLVQESLNNDQKNLAFASRFTAPVQNNTQSQPASQSVVVDMSETGETKPTHASDTITGKDAKAWETEDYARLVSLGSDLVSLTGGITGVVAGLASTASDVIGDFADESLTGWDVAKNAGINLGWTVAGLVPGAKLGKIGKALLKWGPRGVALLDSYGLIKDEKTYQALNRMFTTGEITSQDLNILTQIGRAITGGTAMAKAARRGHIYEKGRGEYEGQEISVKNERGEYKTVLTDSEVARINKVGKKHGQTKANEELQKILVEKHVNEADAKKTVLSKDIFGEGEGRLASLKRSRKELKGESKYAGQTDAHRDYIHEKYGKWMGIENEGQGVDLPSLGAKSIFKTGRDWITGDAQYNRYMEQHDNAARNTSDTPRNTSETPVNTSSDNIAPERSHTDEIADAPSREHSSEEHAHTEAPRESSTPRETSTPTSEAKPSAEEAIHTEIESKKREGQREGEKRSRTESAESSRRQTNNNTKNIKYYQHIAESLPSKYSKEKAQILEELSSYRRPTNSERGKSGKKGRNRNKGGYRKFNPSRIEQILKPIREAGDAQLSLFRKGSKLALLRKMGGILKAQSGTKTNWFEDYKKRYPLQQLGNIQLKEHNQNADNSVLNNHNQDFTLANAYKMNDYYIGDHSNLVGKDIQDYIDNAETQNFNTLQDLVNQYNTDAATIRGTWDYNSDRVIHDHKANTQRGMTAHNQLFRRMFNSRSQSNNNNNLYNIGYQDNIEDVMGTSTWLRRMDQYKSEFDPTKQYIGGLDEEGYARIHKVQLRNGTIGYVYKKANGDIGILDNATAEAMLNAKPDTGTGNTEADTGTDAGTEGNDFDWDAMIRAGQSGEGTRKGIDLYKYLPATLAFGRMMGDIDATNRRTKEYLSRLQVPLQQPWRFDRQVYGDYGTMKAEENQAAQIRSQMNRPFTSNAALASLRQLEGERLAAEQVMKGKLADNQMIHKTYEQSAAEQKENIKRATDVANVNRGLLADAARTRAGIIAAADTANHNSLDAWLMNYVEKPIQEEANRRKAYQDYYDYISMGPMEYDPSTDPQVDALKQELASIAADDPKREEKRADVMRRISEHVKIASQDYKIAQLARFRRLYPYIRQRVPLNYDITYETTGTRVPWTATPSYTPGYKKGGELGSYPSAVIRAKSRDNDRLIKQILEVIRNHKDLAKGVKMTDYSKYLIKNQK